MMNSNFVMKSNYKLSLLSLVLITFCISVKAQKNENFPNNGFGFGFNVNQYQKDFGIGIQIVSPYFASHKIAIRVKSKLMFNETVKDSSTVWNPYSNVSVGLIGVGGMIGESIRLYGEGGMIGLFPSQAFSNKNFVAGGYGQLGFEFFLSNSFNYYIEIGGVGTGAKADKITNKPIYSNGLLLGTGFRIFLK